MQERRAKKKYQHVFKNAIYFLIVFLVALFIATNAFIRRVNTYEITRQPLLFSVSKERVVISNSVTGRVDQISAAIGDHVRKNEALVVLSDAARDEKLNTLNSIATENLSARTEFELLKARSGEYEIRAPRDGVIYEIHAAEGSYLNSSAPILTLFADSNVKLVGSVTPAQYAEIQKNKELNIYSTRFERVYKATFQGVGRVLPETQFEESKYEVQFRFANQEEGAAFIEGETLEAVADPDHTEALLPARRLVQFWNNLLRP